MTVVCKPPSRLPSAIIRPIRLFTCGRAYTATVAWRASAHITDFQTIHNADTDPEAAKSMLLHLITDPAGHGQPPHELHAALIALTAAFLQRGPDGGEEASEKPEDKQTSVRGHSQDKYVKPYERAKHKPACGHATKAQRGAESAPGQQGKVTDERSKTMLACQSCEARGGRHETPPTVPPAVALAEAKAAALRPMPFGCA